MGFLSSLFGIGGGSKPATTTNVVQQQLPKEISPFVTEIAKEAQDLFKERVAEGYTPYTGQTLAPLTAQQEAAMTGIEGLVGTSRPLQEEALGVTRQQAERFTPESAQAYMSPYQRAVTDIEKREAGRQFDVAQQVRDAQAAGAGASSLMGTRSAILEAEAQRNQQQLLADIEAKGLQSAYQDAQRAFETQKARERGMAGDIARTGPAMLASGIQEQGALQRIGEERRALGQSALDEAYFKFLEERQFPEQTLSDYSAFIYGNPMAKLANTTTTGTSTPFQPSLGQTLLGIGSTLGAAALKNPSLNLGKVFGGKSGGQIDRNRGLSGLPMFSRQAGTQVISDEELEMIDQEGGTEKVTPKIGERYSFAGLRSPEEQLALADQRGKDFLELIEKSGATISPGREAVASGLEYLGTRLLTGDSAKAKERLDKSIDRQEAERKETRGLLTKAKVKNLADRFVAEDSAFLAPKQLREYKTKLKNALADRSLSSAEKLLKIQKLRKELFMSGKGIDFSKISSGERDKLARNLYDNFHNTITRDGKPLDENTKAMFEQALKDVDDEKKTIIRARIQSIDKNTDITAGITNILLDEGIKIPRKSKD